LPLGHKKDGEEKMKTKRRNGEEDEEE